MTGGTMRRARRCVIMPSRLVRAVRLLVLLAFALASVGSHSSVRADGAPDCQALQAHEVDVATSSHHAAPCDQQDGEVKHGTCCALGQCMIGILGPPSSPLPQPEPPLLAGSPGRTLAGASPETPYRPPA